MNMKTIALSAIALCTANAWASLSYSEATTTTFDSMLSESGLVWIGSTSGAFDTDWHVWQSADGSLNNGINQIADYARIADAANQKGRLRIESGSYTFPKLNIGDKGTGYLTVNGGKVTTTGQFNVGINGATSVFEMNGGEVIVGSQSYWGADANTTATANINANGVLTLNARLNLVNGNGSTCTVNVDGGKIFALADLQFASGGDDTSTATLNISNGGEVTCETATGAALWVKLSTSGTSKSVININEGGILKAWHFQQISTGKSEINFNGGTLVALGSDNNYNAYLIGDTDNRGHDSYLSMTVGENGGTLDVNGKAIKIKNVVIGGTGRLTITGGGSVKFEAVPTCPLYIEEGVVELPVGATVENITFGKNGFVKFDLSGVSATTGENPEDTILPQSQTLLTGATIVLPDGDTIEEHVIIKNDGKLAWVAAYGASTLQASAALANATAATITVWTGDFSGNWAGSSTDYGKFVISTNNWTGGLMGQGKTAIVPFEDKLYFSEDSCTYIDELRLATSGDVWLYSRGQKCNNVAIAPVTVTGSGTLVIGGMGLCSGSAGSGATIDVPVVATNFQHYAGSGSWSDWTTYIKGGSASAPVRFRKSFTVPAGVPCRIEENVIFDGDLCADGYLTFNHNQTLRGAIAGSGTIFGSFTTAEGAVLKCTASADGGVYSATCLTVEGNADLSNATVEIEGGEALADAESSTEIILLKATGTITWPASVKYVIPGQKYVWTITTGTTTVDETTYKTLKAVRTANGFMVIIAGETEATIEDQSQEAQLSRNYGCLSLV